MSSRGYRPTQTNWSLQSNDRTAISGKGLSRFRAPPSPVLVRPQHKNCSVEGRSRLRSQIVEHPSAEIFDLQIPKQDIPKTALGWRWNLEPKGRLWLHSRKSLGCEFLCFSPKRRQGLHRPYQLCELEDTMFLRGAIRSVHKK